MDNRQLVEKCVKVLRADAAKSNSNHDIAMESVIDSLSSLLSAAMYDPKYAKELVEQIGNST